MKDIKAKSATHKSNKPKPTVKANAFKQAVMNINEIENAYQVGLRALGTNSNKISPTDPRLIEGSVDIDKAVENLYPQENRWDYAIGYNDIVYYLEVHPADTSAVTCVIKKKKWLMNWLSSKAVTLDKLKKAEAYYWIPSGAFSILPNSPQAKKLAQSGLKIVKQLNLR